MGTFVRRKCCLYNFSFKIPRNRRLFIGYRVDLIKIAGDFFSIAFRRDGRVPYVRRTVGNDDNVENVEFAVSVPRYHDV